MLFELSKAVIIPPEIFNEIWPYVDSVYTTLQQELLQAHDTVRVQKYECRLRKSRKSSTARVADGKVIKCRHSSMRDTDLCNVRIKVSCPVDGTSVTFERLDEHIHTHDIEGSFHTKKTSILLGYFKSEACKFYRQYLLPCRHIFHRDTEVKLLTEMQWEVYLMMFAECGMEVYETARTVWVEEESTSRRNIERANIVSHVRESFEQVQQQLYAAYELMNQLNLEDTVQSQ